MKKLFFFILLTLLSQNVFTQGKGAMTSSLWQPYINAALPLLKMHSVDSMKHLKIYRIWIEHQIVELIQEDQQIFKGDIVSVFVPVILSPVQENKSKYRELNATLNVLTERMPIPESTVRKLMILLSRQDIESLPDCFDVKGYQTGMDGRSIYIEIGTHNGKRLYSYWEPESAGQDKSLKEVQNIQAILIVLKSELNLNRVYSSFVKSLPSGSQTLMGSLFDILSLGIR